MYTLYPFLSFVFFGFLFGKGEKSKIGITIVFLYSFEEYFSFPVVLKQYSPFFLPGTHNASHDIHFSIKTLMFILSNSLLFSYLITL